MSELTLAQSLYRKIIFLVFFLFCLIFILPAKEYSKKDDPLLQIKRMGAVKVEESPKIDGVLDDEVWGKSPIATEFIQYSPNNGERSKYRTEVRILYDNSAIYIGAMMYDPRPDSIFTELGPRDSDINLNADRFSIDISPYNDGINGAQFKISVSGVQSDRPPRSGGPGGGGMGGGDHGGGDSWDAVWESKTSITDNGWVAEMRIPYSALRFSEAKVQVWGVNFWREVRRDRETSSWNYVDREIGTTFNHMGELTDIRNIEPPLRLSLNPYVSGYLEKYGSDKAGFSYNGGLDLKYGINESFTLDATLVPDFGQVRSDDQVLNLSPYEVKYNENRPFFMEGTELFDKGGIFYSRRIGAKPRNFYAPYDNLDADEDVTYNPSESALINATKISGRTQSGLGIGVFNAMTRAMFAAVEDTEGNSRQVETNPFTNYNMIVLDQSLKNNSYISLVNTHVWRNATKDENFYTANVTGTDFRIQNKNRQYSVSGQAALSQKYYTDLDDQFGHMFELRGGKTGGKLRVQYSLEANSDTYDPNDMGYLRRNNSLNQSLDISHNIYTPFWRVLTHRTSMKYSYAMLYKPNVFTGANVDFSSSTTFKNYLSLTFRGQIKPLGEDDYYEPRVSGRFYHRPGEFNIMSWISTNRNKKVAGNFTVSYTNVWSDYGQYDLSISLGPDIKFSDRFSMQYDFKYNIKVNDFGYVSYLSNDPLPEDIYFGKRDNTTIENTLQSSYIFTADSYLTLRLRHYWSRADYLDDYYLLNTDGSLSEAVYPDNHDYNYNAFNIDMGYTWRFAPGSELSLVWKNSIYSGSDQIFYDFKDNFTEMFGSEKQNSISLKILYYLDYQYLKKRL